MAPYYVGNLICESMGDGFWMLRESLTYYGSHTVVVPACFVTDWASIPRWLWALMPPHDPRVLIAAVVHDRCYESWALSRAAADALFAEALIIGGLGLLARAVMWAALRIGGASAYRTGPERQRARRRRYLLMGLG